MTTLMDPDVLAEEIYTTLTTQPELHDNGRWRFDERGSAMCIAGWAVHISGFNAAPGFGCVPLRDIPVELHKRIVGAENMDVGELIPTKDLAKALLDLTPNQVSNMFFGSNEASLRYLKEAFSL